MVEFIEEAFDKVAFSLSKSSSSLGGVFLFEQKRQGCSFAS
ncbi:hypothetical protein [Bartonella quintana]|nr:hypothetical protein [Bartonella quintana]